MSGYVRIIDHCASIYVRIIDHCASGYVRIIDHCASGYEHNIDHCVSGYVRIIDHCVSGYVRIRGYFCTIHCCLTKRERINLIDAYKYGGGSHSTYPSSSKISLQFRIRKCYQSQYLIGFIKR